MEKLAYIGRITSLDPIPNSDNIEAATVVLGSGGIWKGVVRKNEFQVGSTAEVYLQDAILPPEPRFAFLEKKKYRINIARFRGALSECLIVPSTIDEPIGTDITERVGVIKYEKPLPEHLMGENSGGFPNFIPKTDELNFQAVPERVAMLQGKPFYASIKADGSSVTFYWDIDTKEIVACSRSLRKKNTENSAHYRMVRKYNLETVLEKTTLAIQAEMVGPKIQKNKMGLPDLEIRVFDVYDYSAREYFSPEQLQSFCKRNNIPAVDIVELGSTIMSMDHEALVRYAECRTYTNGHAAEGVVFRQMERATRHDRVSFKVINPLYKD